MMDKKICSKSLTGDGRFFITCCGRLFFVFIFPTSSKSATITVATSALPDPSDFELPAWTSVVTTSVSAVATSGTSLVLEDAT